jgi:hypothetical protein
VPIAEIADARTRQQSVDIPPASVERPCRRADEDDCLIGGNLHPKVKSPAVHLTDDWKLCAPLYGKAPAVDGAVRPDLEAQLAA